MHCPYDGVEVQPEEDFVICPCCTSMHHPECWRANANRCSNPGCTGAGARPVQSFRKEPSPQPRPPSRPASSSLWSRRLDGAMGVVDGAAAWGLLGWAIVSLVLTLLPVFGLPSWSSGREDNAVRVGILVAAVYGVRTGLRSWEPEARRLIHGLAGFVVFRVFSQLLVMAYSLGSPGRVMWPLPPELIVLIASWLGVMLGGFWPAAGQTLLRGGLGALLGLYLAAVISFVWPDPVVVTQQLQLALLAIITAASLIPLLSPVSVRGMIRAVAAALPGAALIWLFRVNARQSDSSSFFQLALFSLLLALPIAGIAHKRLASSGTLSLTSARANTPLSEMLRLGRAGLVGAAFVLLIVALIVIIGSLLSPLIVRLVDVLMGLSIVAALLSGMGLVRMQVPVYGGLVAVLTVYASLFGIGRLERRGLLYGSYRFTRFLTLALLCCLTAFLTEQALETALRDWPAFQSFGGYLLWMGYALPAGMVLLGLIYSLAYVRDRMPFFLIGFGFVLWLAQLILLSGALAFVGGVLGLWAGVLLAPLFDSWGHQAVYGLSWQQTLPLVGSYLGFFGGLGRPLLKWMRKDLGMLVSEYRRVVLRYAALADARIDRLIQLREPWWAIAGFGAATIWATYQFVGIIAPVLVRRF